MSNQVQLNEMTKRAFLGELQSIMLVAEMEKQAGWAGSAAKRVGGGIKSLFRRGGRSAGGLSDEAFHMPTKAPGGTVLHDPTPALSRRGGGFASGPDVKQMGELSTAHAGSREVGAFASRAKKSGEGLENLLAKRMESIEGAMASGKMSRPQAVAEMKRISGLRAQARQAGIPEHVALGSDPARAAQAIGKKPALPTAKTETARLTEATNVGRPSRPPMQSAAAPAGAQKPSMPGATASEPTMVLGTSRPAVPAQGTQVVQRATPQPTAVAPTPAVSPTPVGDWMSRNYKGVGLGVGLGAGLGGAAAY